MASLEFQKVTVERHNSIRWTFHNQKNPKGGKDQQEKKKKIKQVIIGAAGERTGEPPTGGREGKMKVFSENPLLLSSNL